MNRTEIFVKNFYQTIDVLDADSMNIATISERINVSVRYWPHSSTIAACNDNCRVFLDETKSEQEQWQEFGHEMYHYLFDDTSYYSLPEIYGHYGETKADHFAYHFCVPTFMLQQMEGANTYDVVNLFNVEYEFAMRRLEMYQNKIINGGKIIETPKWLREHI